MCFLFFSQYCLSFNFAFFSIFEKQNLKTLFSGVSPLENLLMDRRNLIPCFSTHSPGPGCSKFNANPALKFNRSIRLSFRKEMVFTAYVLCSLRLFKLKTEEQTI